MTLPRFFTSMIFTALVFVSCNSKSLDDYYDEGQNQISSIISDLESIQTRQQLLDASSRLQKQYIDLVNIIISAEEYLDKHPDQKIWQHQETLLSDRLREELNRLYQIEGAREIMEKCQQEALYRLDAYEQRRSKSI